MNRQLTHASFFSGVGGLDLGFEKAGIRTVSVSEIDPFARAVLASRFPDVPQLGDIVALADHELSSVVQQTADVLQRRGGPADGEGRTTSGDDWKTADIWSAGFPCQDLSVAGKRKGFTDGKRSVLAFTFLNLVERFRPRWLVLENVPGLFTSNDGRDFLALLNEVDQLGYGISWRTLDARFFGVPQRRRRVFIVASLGSNRAGEVLLECEGGCGHPQAGRSSWQEFAGSSERSPDVAGALLARYHKGATSTVENGQLVVVGSQVDSSGVREADGLAGGLDNPNYRAMMQQAQRENDLLLGATTQGFGIGQQARQQGLQEQAYLRNEPLNTLNAVRTGAQVQGPNFVNPAMQANTAGADILGATQMGYNAQLAASNAQNAANNAMTQGLSDYAKCVRA